MPAMWTASRRRQHDAAAAWFQAIGRQRPSKAVWASHKVVKPVLCGLPAVGRRVRAVQGRSADSCSHPHPWILLQADSHHLAWAGRSLGWRRPVRALEPLDDLAAGGRQQLLRPASAFARWCMASSPCWQILRLPHAVPSPDNVYVEYLYVECVCNYTACVYFTHVLSGAGT